MRLLITGGSSDIGRAVAARRHEAGDEIVITCSGEESLAATLKSYKADGIKATGFVYDLARPDAAADAVAKALEPGLGGLVLNAASRVTKFRVHHECPESYFNKYVSDNVFGNTWLLKNIIPAMLEKGFGRLVFISSLSAASGTSRYGAYCTAKAALEGLFLNLAVDYGAEGITANIVRPGLIATERTKKFWSNEKYAAGAAALIPQGRLGKPDEVACALDPLLSPECYMNGSVVTVSGGFPLIRPKGAMPS